MQFKLIELVSGIFKPAAELIDEIHTSDEERLSEHRKTLEVQAKVLQEVLRYEQEIAQARFDVIKAEATSEHWLAANWRPVTMLTFLSIVVLDYAGQALGNDTLVVQEMWTLLQIGLGGYVVGRSGEKVVKAIKQ